MTNLSEMLLASLLLNRRARGNADTRRGSHAAPGYDRDDLEAARGRARKRS